MHFADQASLRKRPFVMSGMLWADGRGILYRTAAVGRDREGLASLRVVAIRSQSATRRWQRCGRYRSSGYPAARTDVRGHRHVTGQLLKIALDRPGGPVLRR